MTNSISATRLVAAFLFAAVALMAGDGAPEDPLRTRAVGGDADAQYRLADELFFGRNGRMANVMLAVYWYRRAAVGGVPAAQYNLGRCYMAGWGVRRSLQLAYHWFAKASDSGLRQAAVPLAELDYIGVPEENNPEGHFPMRPASPEKALESLRKLAVGGYAPARLSYASHLYLEPESRRKHGREIREQIEALLANGDADDGVCILAARVFMDGIGGVPDMKRAVNLLERCANTNPEAMTMLADSLEFGFGCKADPERSIALLRKAADMGNADAMVRLAVHSRSGTWIPRDPSACLEYLRRAAEKSCPAAIRELGVIHQIGFGVERDNVKAFEYLDRAAHMDDVEAQYQLGICFRDGTGTEVDPPGAFYWFRRAAVQGHVGAMREAGAALLDGRGVARNAEDGIGLLREAARRGDRIANEIMNGATSK